MDAERRLAELGVELPPVAAPLASYVPAVRTGDLVFVAGQVPISPLGAVTLTGKLGDDVSLEQGVAAARQCALQALAAVRAEIGTLDRIRRIVKVSVFVASSRGFSDQPKVANGASDLFQEVFGEQGRHARVAVGVAELPLGAAVEVELIAEVD
jgi:enamine deaminase RidA (YjgF/YER057c/UK114 family)